MSPPEPAIRLREVGKRYVQVHDADMLLTRMFRPMSRRRDDFWALRDIDLELPRGGTLGVLGRNGSGKTTLLRLLAGVTAPSTGSVRIRGRIAPLIGVGVGFDDELTGVENVHFNGRLLGMSTETIRARLPEIVAFSELGDAVNMAVKYYSSGMFLRLAFAVAVHTEPDVMLVDEVLAVGDASFQARCLDRMRMLRENGTTIVVVSHNLETVERMCDETIVLDDGRIAHRGATDDAVRAYQRILNESRVDDESGRLFLDDGGPTELGGVTVSASVEVEGVEVDEVPSGATFAIRVRAEFEREVVDPRFGVSVSAPGHGIVYSSMVQAGSYAGTHGPGAPLEFAARLENHLLPGSYVVRAAVVHPTLTGFLGSAPPTTVSVVGAGGHRGIVGMGAVYVVDGDEVEPSFAPRMWEAGS